MKKFLFTIFIILSFAFVFFFIGGKILTNFSIKTKVEELRDSTDFSKKEIFYYNKIDSLNPLIKKFFKAVIKDSSTIPNFVTIEQSAEFKTNESSDWIKLAAKQYFTTYKPNYLWNAELNTSKYFWVNAIDSYINNKGNTLIKLNSSITIADSWGIEIDKSGLFRYLSEAVLFPTVLLPSNNLLWNILDSNIAELKFIDGDNSVVAKFYFDINNRVSKIETYDKYRMVESQYKKALHTIYFSDYKLIDNTFYIPTHFLLEWQLKNDNFTYGKFNITKIVYE